MRDCRHADQITDAMEGALPFWRRLFHRVHLAFCFGCRCTEHQLRATVGAVKGLTPPPPRAEVKERLLQEFRSRCKR